MTWREAVIVSWTFGVLLMIAGFALSSWVDDCRRRMARPVVMVHPVTTGRYRTVSRTCGGAECWDPDHVRIGRAS